MNYEQMLVALQALGECSLMMRKPGDWYVSQRTEIKNGPVLEGRFGNGNTPMAAVADHWKQLTELAPGQYIVTHAYDRAQRRGVRWNGFMWAEAEPQPSEGESR